MKSKHLLLLGAALCCLFTVVNSAFPQGTTFTYNGQLKDIATGQPANGSFDLRFILYTADAGGSQVGPILTNAPLGVTNGLFTATLDFGAGIFDGSARWLEIGVRTNGSVGAYDVLSPRAWLTPTPYAIYAGNAASAGTATTANSATNAASVPWSGLTGVPAGFADGTDNDTTYTAGAGLNLSGIQFSLNFAGSGSASTASHSDHIHPPGDATTLDGLDSTAFAGTAHTHSFSQITGSAADPQLSANVTLLDRATQSFTGANTFSPATDITGLRVRQSNVTTPTADIFTVQNADGSATHFRINSSGQASWSGTAIGALSGNASSASAAPWGGLTGLPAGFADNVDNDTTYSAGSGLSLAGTQFNVNFAGTGTTNSSARSDHTHPQSDATTLDGLDSTAFALTNSSPVFTGTVTAGGDLVGARLRVGTNHNLTGTSATIAGGLNNTNSGSFGTVSGGWRNIASDVYATVGGGRGNIASGRGATVGGGQLNTASAESATVGGGELNQILGLGYRTTISGGSVNLTKDSQYSSIGGGGGNQISNFLFLANFTTIAGGSANVVIDAGIATIGGGEFNRILGGSGSTIAGGRNNAVSINAIYASIPGGRDNTVGGSYGLAAGRRAKANQTGAFVWADSTDADFASTAADQFLIRASGGVGIGVTDPDTQLVVAGKIKAHNGVFAPPANGVNGGNGDKLILWPGLASATPYSLGIDAGTMWFGVPGIPGTAFKWYYGTTERMRLTDGGNLGIGTDSPASPLHVNGRITTGVDFGSAGAITFRPPDGFAYFHIDNGPAGGRPTGRLRFSYGANPGDFDVISMTQQGRVGIGTASPAMTLDVKGDVSVSGAYVGTNTPTEFLSLLGVNTAGWPVTTVVIRGRALDDSFLSCWNSSGNFGGTPVFTFYTNGIAYKPGGGSWAALSDRRLKKDIRDLDGALEQLLRLRSVSFEFKEPERTGNFPGRHVGFIAQEAEQVFPDWVSENQDGYKVLSICGFESLTVQALRELRTEKDAEIQALKKQNREMEKRLTALEQLINRQTTAQTVGER